MKFSELLLENVTFEVRYEQKFLFWDNSGKILVDIAAKYPKIEIRDVNLSNVNCEWWDAGIGFTFDHSRASTWQGFPEQHGLFEEFADRFLETVNSHLDVQSFSRVGCRHIFSFPTKGKGEALEILRSCEFFSEPRNRLQPFGDAISESLMRVEDDDRGYTIRVSADTRDVKVRIQRPWTVDRGNWPEHALLFDIDAYTKKLVTATDLRPADFMKSVARNIRENLLKTIGI